MKENVKKLCFKPPKMVAFLPNGKITHYMGRSANIYNKS